MFVISANAGMTDILIPRSMPKFVEQLLALNWMIRPFPKGDVLNVLVNLLLDRDTSSPYAKRFFQFSSIAKPLQQNYCFYSFAPLACFARDIPSLGCGFAALGSLRLHVRIRINNKGRYSLTCRQNRSF